MKKNWQKMSDRKSLNKDVIYVDQMDYIASRRWARIQYDL